MALIQVSDTQRSDMDILAEAIAASYHMRPRAWLCRFGGIAAVTKMPKGFHHLVSDYNETKAEMLECVQV